MGACEDAPQQRHGHVVTPAELYDVSLDAPERTFRYAYRIAVRKGTVDQAALAQGEVQNAAEVLQLLVRND